MTKDIKILYLDDEPDYLKDAKESFLEYGYEITTSQSINGAKRATLSEEFNIIICDLKLDDINGTSEINGNSVLQELRQANNGTFLALYTAFKGSLRSEDKRTLESNNIKIYDKGEIDELVLNLEKDYDHFTENIRAHEQFYYSISSIVKKQAINHLRNTDKEQAIVTGDGTYSPEQLLKEIEQDTDTGRQYIKDWAETMDKILDVRNEIKHEKKKSNFIFWKKG